MGNFTFVVEEDKLSSTFKIKLNYVITTKLSFFIKFIKCACATNTLKTVLVKRHLNESTLGLG